MAVTLSKSAILTMSVVAAGLVVLTLVLLQGADEDQNPIRVKNYRLRIETEDKDAKWHKPGAAQKWRLDVDNRLTTTGYTVTGYGANSGCEAPLEGSSVEIQFQVKDGPLQTLTFSIQRTGNKDEPVLDTGATLKEDNSKKTKKLMIDTDPDGAITQLIVRDAATIKGTCNFPGDRRVEVELCMHNCS